MHAPDHSDVSQAKHVHFKVVAHPPHVDGFFGFTKKSEQAAVPKKSLFSRLTGRKNTTVPVPSVPAAKNPIEQEETESRHQTVMPASDPYRTSLVAESNKAGSLHGFKWGVLTTQGHHQYMRIKDIGRFIGDPLEGKLCPFDTSYAVRFITSQNTESQIDVEGWGEHSIQPSEILRYMVSPLEYLQLHNNGPQPPVHEAGDPVVLSNHISSEHYLKPYNIASAYFNPYIV